MDCSHLPGSSVHGTFQARILEWVAIAFSMGISWWLKYTYIQMYEKKDLWTEELKSHHRGNQATAHFQSPVVSVGHELEQIPGDSEEQRQAAVWHNLATEYNNGVCINYCLWITYWSISSTEHLSAFILMIVLKNTCFSSWKSYILQWLRKVFLVSAAFSFLIYKWCWLYLTQTLPLNA